MSIWDKERTICWECEKTCGGCSWSREFKPVDGWEAVETTDCTGDKSFLVRKCPEFVRENREKRRDAQAMDTDGCMALIEKMLDVARDDYICGDEDTQHQIERFIRGKGASKIHMISEPDQVIRKLRIEADEHKKRHETENLIKDLEKLIEQLGSLNIHFDEVDRAVSFLKERKAKKALTDKYRNRICPSCGMILKAMGRYCSQCGQEIKTND